MVSVNLRLYFYRNFSVKIPVSISILQIFRSVNLLPSLSVTKKRHCISCKISVFLFSEKSPGNNKAGRTPCVPPVLFLFHILIPLCGESYLSAEISSAESALSKHARQIICPQWSQCQSESDGSGLCSQDWSQEPPLYQDWSAH